MQVINLEATISTPSLQVEMRTLRLGSGGTTDYNDLSNKPMIEGVTLQGNVPISDLGLRTSDLINDSGFITTGDIPTKTSDLTNDSDFQTGAEVAASITAAIPTNVSSFTNDVGYITAAAIPTNVSAFTNDAGYLTSGDLPALTVDSVNGQTGTVVLTGADIECGGAYHTNDAISTQIDAFTTDIASINANMPTKTSDLQNDSGYITATGAPVQTVNGATGDVVLDGSDIEYSVGVTVNSKIDSVEAAIPTDTNDLTNGAGYITAAGAPVQSVNTLTGNVVLTANNIDGLQASYNEISNAGSTVTLSDAANDTPVGYLNIEISPIQASGTPTPSDPLPITGTTDITITVTDSESNITTNNVSLGQTVYGGTLNVITGELTITYGIVDFGNLTWTYDSGNLRFQSSVSGIKAPSEYYGIPDWLCSSYEVVAIPTFDGTPKPDLTIRGTMNNTVIFVRNTNYTDPATFKTDMTGVQLVYKLDTPITTKLTPTNIKTYETLCTITISNSNCNIKDMRYFTEGSEFLVSQVSAILKAYNLL